MVRFSTGLVVAAVLVFVPAALAGSVFEDGADRLTALQNTDGGWDWPLDDGNPGNASPLNTIGPIAMGLIQAYQRTGDPAHLAAIGDAATFLLAKTNNFSPSDGYLAAALDGLYGGTTYRDHLKTNFYDPLAAGTYDSRGLGVLYDTAAYVDRIRTLRSGSQANMAAWDIGMGAVAAVAAGADATEWTLGIKAEIDELDTNNYYAIIGLAGAVYGLSEAGEDFDPTSGSFAAAADLGDLGDLLAAFQLGNGGFTWADGFTDASDATTQETAYAILALFSLDRDAYGSNIAAANGWLVSTQLPTGGWANYIGAGENNEITGEALWALSTVPVPAAAWTGMALLAGLGLCRRIRRRR